MSIRMTQTTELAINAELQRHWNRKLNRSFALTPREKRAEVDAQKYREWNEEFDLVTSGYVKQELKLLREDLGADGLTETVVTVLGPGLARGLGFIPYANRLGMRVDLYDVSKLAVKMTNAFLRKKEVYSKNSVYHQEIRGDADEISHFSRLIVMSQFLQILPRERMKAVMKMVGKQMNFYECRTVIVHPFGENTGWGDTTPYTLDDLFAPIKDTIGLPPKIIRERDIRYFDHHNYKAFTIQLS